MRYATEGYIRTGKADRPAGTYRVQREQAEMTNPIPVPIKMMARVLLLCAPAFTIAACVPPPPAPAPGACNACEAMERANAAYALAQKAEADALAARTTTYQHSLYK